MLWFWLRIYPQRGGTHHVICERASSPQTSQQNRSHLMVSLIAQRFVKDMFLIKDEMNTYKKQKHKQGMPQEHSGCDLRHKNSKQNLCWERKIMMRLDRRTHVLTFRVRRCCNSHPKKLCYLSQWKHVQLCQHRLKPFSATYAELGQVS